MPQTARMYLLDRFRSDAVALRARADALAATTRKTAPTPGPDAAMSRRMAIACESVVAMIEAVPEVPDAARALGAIAELIPLLEHRAAQEQGAPPVRAVYVGAATRIREVQAAELKAGANAGDAVDMNGHHDDDVSDEAFDDDDSSDEVDDELDDIEDDDVDDDELHPGTPL